MLTDEQKLKAKQALAKRNGEDVTKQLAFEWHKQAKAAFSSYGLPYKVYYNYLKDRYYNPSETVKINPCYPLPGYPADRVIHVSHDDFLLDDLPEDCTTLEDAYIYDRLCEDKKIDVDRLNLQIKPWKPLDDKWKKYFAVFLIGYDYSNFSEFDFMGEVGTLEHGDLSLLQRYYSHLIDSEYKEHKKDYLTQIPKYEPEYRFLYSDKPFEIIWDKDTIMERVKLEKQMNIKPDERQRKIYAEKYGVDIYEQ